MLGNIPNVRSEIDTYHYLMKIRFAQMNVNMELSIDEDAASKILDCMRNWMNTKI